MHKVRVIMIVFSLLGGLLCAQTRSDFDFLYRYYSGDYFQRIHRFFIKDMTFGLVGTGDSNFFMHPDIVENDNSLSWNVSFRGAFLYKQKLLLEVLPSLAYVTHFDHPDYNHLNRSINTNLFLKIGNRLMWLNSYAASRRRWRVYDTFGKLAVFDNQSLRTRLTYETARRTALFMEAGLSRIDVSGDLFEEENLLDERFNREIFSLKAGLEYRLTAKTTASLSATLYTMEFPNFSRQDHEGFQVELGVRFPRVGTDEGRIGGQVVFGIKTYELMQFGRNFTTWTANTDLVVAKGRQRWQLQVDRDFDFAIFQISPLVRTRAFGGVDHYVSPGVFVGAGFYYGHLDFKVPLIVDWERLHIRADYRKPVIRVGIRTVFDYWLILSWSPSDWSSDNYNYYNKQRTVVSLSITKRR